MIEKASKLPNADAFDKSDPYVIVTALGEKTPLMKTKTMINDDNPVFNEERILNVNQDVKKLTFQVVDEDTFSADDWLGECTLDLKNFSGTVSLRKGAGKGRKKIKPTEPTLTFKVSVAGESSECCGGCSVM